MNLIWKSIPHSGGIKSKTITKLFDIFMNKRVELWNDKEIATTLTATWYYKNCCRKKDMEQNTWENLCEETCQQEWLS